MEVRSWGLLKWVSSILDAGPILATIPFLDTAPNRSSAFLVRGQPEASYSHSLLCIMIRTTHTNSSLDVIKDVVLHIIISHYRPKKKT